MTLIDDLRTAIAWAGVLLVMTVWVAAVSLGLGTRVVARRVRRDVEGQGGTRQWAKKTAVRAGGTLLVRWIKNRLG
jgi:hypothetical protein